MAKHEKAIPTSANLKRLYPVITAEELQLCFEKGQIGKEENKKLECMTPYCHAPITCKNMTNKNKTAFFIEGKRTENLHHQSCPFSEEAIVQPMKKEQSASSTYEPSGLTVWDSKHGYLPKGFGLSSNVKKKVVAATATTEELTDEYSTDTSTSIPKKEKNSLPVKPRDKHVSSLGQAVVRYEENKDFIIHKGPLGENIPISRYFQPIGKNHLPEKYNDRVPIFYGIGFVHFSKKGYYTFTFLTKIVINGSYYRPHFFVSQSFIDQYFPFIQELAKNRPNSLNIYIQERFWFGSSNYGKPILRFQKRGKELFPFIYFTERQ
ncbi:hypothetical protein ABWJ86_00435 [Enterococcus faecalis]|uniref:hypothetical protein n=1 Tax=Enterococcus faecalis TaxID=1351 RepID=UPI003391402F